MLYGFIAVVFFSPTAPFIKLALEGFSPYFVTVGRMAVAGTIAAGIIYIKKDPLPERVYWKQLLIVSLGSSVGFPLFLSIALEHTEASHAGIVLAILPLFTSIIGAWINKERHRIGFWFMALSGCFTVVFYIFWKNGIALTTADLWLLAASISGAIAYSVGSSISKHIGGLGTICWSLIFMLPLSIPTMLYLFWHVETLINISATSVAAFFYLAIVSQLLAFIPWYAGLNIGGTASVSQVQLLQTFLTLFNAALFLGEKIAWQDWLVAILVVFQVYLIKKMA